MHVLSLSYGAHKETCNVVIFILFRLYEILFRLYEILFRLYEILFRLYKILFSLYEILFRLYKMLSFVRIFLFVRNIISLV